MKSKSNIFLHAPSREYQTSSDGANAADNKVHSILPSENSGSLGVSLFGVLV